MNLTSLSFLVAPVVAVGTALLPRSALAVEGRVEIDGRLAFHYARTESVNPDGVHETKQTYRDPSGNVVSVETVRWVPAGINDDNLLSYTWTESLRQWQGSLLHSANQAVWTFTEKHHDSSKERRDTSDWEPRLTAGPILLRHVENNWDKLLAGESVSVRLALLDRLETVGFTFKHEPQGAAPGRTRFVMKPTSFIIKLIAPKVVFDFDTATRQVVRIEGPCQIPVREGDAWRLKDGVTVLEPARGPVAVWPKSGHMAPK